MNENKFQSLETFVTPFPTETSKPKIPRWALISIIIAVVVVVVVAIVVPVVLLTASQASTPVVTSLFPDGTPVFPTSTVTPTDPDDLPYQVALVYPQNLYIPVHNASPGYIFTINKDTHNLVGSPFTLAVGQNGAVACVLSPNLRTLYVLCETSKNIVVLDVSTTPYTTEAVIPLASAPQNGVVTPDGNTLYVACTDSVVQINTGTNMVANTLTGSNLNNPKCVICNPTQTTLYVGSGNVGGIISVIDITNPNTPNLLDTNITLGSSLGYLLSLAITNHGQFLYAIPTSSNDGVEAYLYSVDLVNANAVSKSSTAVNSHILGVRGINLSLDNKSVLAGGAVGGGVQTPTWFAMSTNVADPQMQTYPISALQPYNNALNYVSADDETVFMLTSATNRNYVVFQTFAGAEAHPTVKLEVTSPLHYVGRPNPLYLFLSRSA